MFAVYRFLLCLYPFAYRCQYEEEMLAVLGELDAAMAKRGAISRVIARAREVGGLLSGALREQVRFAIRPYDYFKSSRKRPAMGSEFRFPKSTVMLMLIILAGIIVAIDKARAIEFSAPRVNPSVGPIHPAHGTVFVSLFLTMLAAGLAATTGWIILFALRRSGLHRFSEIDPCKEKQSHMPPSA